MWVIFVAIPIALVLVVVSGGSIRRVVDAPWRAVWLIILSALVPIPLSIWATPADRGAWWPFLVTELAFGLMILWCWLNRWLSSAIALIALGTFLNMAVIAANNGAMPIRSSENFETHLYRPERSGDRLTVLDDWIGLPGENYISLGDLLVMAGFIGTVVVTGRKRARSATHA